ncbi:MAG: hypothetical protein JJ713_04295 [Acidithiobacillus sp.]|uniref:hypothetical protein n=1 Tax=Acidithiobacillus sp. TaxID=1872118 RepID=UPI0025901619|nr:hypothetical protein [Acidithiobacillus sp.]MCE5419993.1 hypothetical protein [Acidithiobacillus sp.]
MKKWIYAAIVALVVALSLAPMFFKQGPYGGKTQGWYQNHPEQTAKELAWCREKPQREKTMSCQYAHNGAVARLAEGQ